MQNNKGFTLIEMLVVISLFAILAGLATINLARPQSRATLNSAMPKLVAEIRNQQANAMYKKVNDNNNTKNYGVYFESDGFTLFEGTTYNPTKESNYKINTDTGIEITNINLPNQQIVFEKGSGEVFNYSVSQNTFSLTNTQINESINLSINRYGIVSPQ